MSDWDWHRVYDDAIAKGRSPHDLVLLYVHRDALFEQERAITVDGNKWTGAHVTIATSLEILSKRPETIAALRAIVAEGEIPFVLISANTAAVGIGKYREAPAS